MKIIVGLGNPEDKYLKTRHNLGFIVLDEMLGDVNWQKSSRFKALIYQEGDSLYVKPQTYMNKSGDSVLAILSYYKLLPKKIGLFNKKDSDLRDVLTVIHDDIDIDLGKWKTAENSRSGGNNGVQSIIEKLKTNNFKRIKLGVKNDLLRTHIPAEKFVLQRFSAEEKEIISKVIKEVVSTL